MKFLSSKSWISRCAFLFRQGANTYFYSDTKLHRRWHHLLWLKKILLYFISFCSHSWNNHSSFNITKVYYRWLLFSKEQWMLKYIWDSFFFPLVMLWCTSTFEYRLNLALCSPQMMIWFMLIFCSCRSFPIGQKTAFKEGYSKTGPGHGAICGLCVWG